MSEQNLDSIAIVGMAGRFPGAESIDEYWRNLCAGQESITHFSKQDLLADGVAADLVNDPNYVRARGVINSPEKFDAAFFGMTPREAELTDPQQRIFLETCWHAMEDAGHAPNSYAGSVGVWGGMSTGMTNNTYLLSNLHASAGGLEREDVLPAMLGNENDYLTTRVSFKLNLRGPSVNVQSACSTSLVAIAQAYNTLMTYGCDMALAGGVSVSYPQKDGYLHQEGDIGSPDGHCRPFDADAQGTVFSNGVGVVVLKRLEDALADNDRIYAVIRGAALNNDGAAKVSFAAPSPDGQAEVIATAQALADVEPESITYIETHGTGTALGDPIEIAGLTKAFGGTKVERPYCALGSVKSNFGHLDSAAGVAAFIKTVLCLHHKKLVPTLHYKKPNPRLSFTDSPFYVNTEYKDWNAGVYPRRAGVSGFGIGGTNAHLVLEEYPVVEDVITDDVAEFVADDVKDVAEASPDNTAVLPEVLVFSAKTKAALNDLLSAYAAPDASWLGESLANVAFTLREGRETFAHRAAMVVNDLAALESAVQKKDTALFTQGKRLVNGGNIVYMFPGGGAQYIGMAADLYAKVPSIRATIDEGLQLLKTQHSIDLAPVWFGGEDQAVEFLRPSLQLPAIFIVEYALARWWIDAGIEPAALVGHSAGENAAACIAGVMSFEDCLGLVTLRGKLFETVEPSGMLSVAENVERIAQYLQLEGGGALDIATINSPDTCTISGSKKDLDTLAKKLASDDIEAQVIPINIAAHSRLLDPILDEFKAYLESIELRAPTLPIVSNLTGQWMTEEQACSPQYWTDHLRNTVKFADCAGLLLEDDETVFLEVGPGKTLASLVRLQAPGRAAAILSSLRHRQEACDDNQYLAMAHGRLWCAGVNIDWQRAGYLNENMHRVSLPLYPFQRKPYLVEPAKFAANITTATTGIPTAGLVNPAGQVPAMHYAASPLVAGANVQTPAASPQLQEHSNVSSLSRKEYIREKLTDTIEEMSGLDREDIEPGTTFLDMGFDSLFLTQANLKFKKEFGVKITFRQLFEDAPSIEALSGYIDEQLPEGALQDKLQPAVQATTEQPQAISAQTATPGWPLAGAMPGAGVDLQQALVMQMQASNAILALLTGAPAPTQQAAVGAPLAPNTPAPVDAQAKGAPSSNVVPIDSSPSEVVAKGFGPYRPLDTGRGGLDERAREALDKFIEAYSARTAKSKQLANQQRPHLSDARSISGFRVDWKEVVYQIAGAGSKGSRIWDIDGNEYLDVTSGFGCNILGYSLDPVVEAIKKQADAGFELGTLSPLASEAAKLVCDLTGMERATFTNTGSESLSAACRAARTVTGKDKIAVFYDEYHGISDELLVNIQRMKGGKTRTVPTSPGIPQFLVENVLVLEWDDPHYMDKLRENADELAALIIEPVQNRNPALQTHVNFAKIRELTQEEDIALIFDEMITGFRLHAGGAQAYFGVQADMCCYGKIVSAGMSLSVLAGRGEYLDCFDGGPWQFGDSSFPEAGVTFFGGTYTRHPIALAGTLAGLKLIAELSTDDYEQLNRRSSHLANQLNEMMVASGFPARFENNGSIFNLKFNDENPFSRLIIYYLRHHGILIYDRPFFISMAHTEADLEQFKEAVANSIDELQISGIVPPVTMDGFYGGSQTVAFSAAQQEVWLATLLGEDAARAYNEQVIYKMDTCLDIDALRHAMQKVAYRHEGLRSTALPDGEGLEVHPAIHIPVTNTDLRDGKNEATPEKLRAFYEQQIDQSFDIYNGPLIRLAVARTGEQSSVLVMTAHHLVIDGWSMGIVLHDLSAYYKAAVNSERFGVVASDQLSGFNRMQIEELASEEQLETEQYWLQQYAGTLPEPPALPLDFPRPVIKSYSGHRISRVVDDSLYQKISAHSAAHKCTLFTSLFSAFTVWVNKITSQSDLVIGVPVAGQALWGCPDAVGHMVSYLPFRVNVDAAMSYDAHLEKIRSYTLEANDHQRFTYGSLLQKLDVKRDPSQMPLTSISFNVDQGMSTFDFGGVSAEYVVCPRNFVKYDLFFNIVDEGDGMSLEVDFNSDLFEESTINLWVDQFEGLLTKIVQNPESKIAGLSLANESDFNMLSEQCSKVDNTFYQTALPFPQAFAEAAAQHAEKIAVQTNKTQLTYAQLDAQSNRLANHLIETGLSKGEYIGVVLPRDTDMLVALLAIMKAGGTYVPIDPGYPLARVKFMIEASNCSLLLSTSELADTLPPVNKAVVLLDEHSDKIQNSSEILPDVSLCNSDLAYVIFTSGSTGEPKGVKIHHGAMINFLQSMRKAPGFAAEDCLLAVTTLSFDIAVLELYLPLLCGGRVLIASNNDLNDGQALVRLIEKYDVTVMQATPSSWQLLLLSDWGGKSNLKALCGGEPMQKGLAQELLQNVGELWNMYGPTETTVWSTCFQITNTNEPIYIGKPIANTTCYILDEQLCPVAVGSVGELYIGGLGVADGYLNKPELTAERFVPDPIVGGDARMYCTGDLACYSESGNLLHKGRVDHQVKVRGYRIELGEIEHQIGKLDNVLECVAVVREDKVDDKRLVAYVRLEGGVTLPLAQLRDQLALHLPDYMLPGAVVEIQSIPLMPNGKVDRNALPAPTIQHSPLGEDLPSTDNEKYLAGVWAEILADDTPIYLDDNLFDIGGHSLLAAKISARVRKDRRVELSVMSLITGTLGQLAGNLPLASEVVVDENLVAANEPPRRTLLSKLFGR